MHHINVSLCNQTKATTEKDEEVENHVMDHVQPQSNAKHHQPSIIQQTFSALNLTNEIDREELERVRH